MENATENHETNEPREYVHRATYSPQDDKIRLYFSSRIPKDEWNRLKDAGFTWTMKQAENGGCDMVAVWSVDREDIALEMAGEIEDEDQPREERAADRAERFGGYQEKRLGEAVELADRYDAGPRVHGHQNQARAERARARHDRIAGKAVNQWEKAEYWQRRTAGVIAHALYQERADVRHRRIKGIEAELRRLLADVIPSKVLEGVEHVRRYCGDDYVAKGHDCVGMFGQGRARWPRSFCKANGPKLSERGERIRLHLELRLAYERQMLAAQGGTMADVVEMVAGGFYGRFQIQKVTKDRAGRVSKVYFIGPHPYKEGLMSLHGIDAERMTPGAYRAPTAEEAAAFDAAKKAASKAKPKAPPLLNPSKEAAQRLQAVWNAAHVAERRDYYQRQGYRGSHVEQEVAKIEAVAVLDLIQAQYSELSGGAYSPYKTVDLAADWSVVPSYYVTNRDTRKPVAFRVRVASSSTTYGAPRVITITDKATHALPAVPAPVTEPTQQTLALAGI